MAVAAHPGDNGPIVYTHSGDIWRLDPGTNTQLTGTSDIIERSPVISPDGTRIAYAAPPPLMPDSVFQDFNDGVWVMGVDGSNPRFVTTPIQSEFLEAEDLTWSPDGTRIAFEALSNVYDSRPRIWVVDADGSGGGPVTPMEETWEDPTWSPVPGSTQIAALHQSDLFVLDIATGQGWKVLEALDMGSVYSPYAPDWSPDGTLLVLECGPTDICTVKPDGSDLFIYDFDGMAQMPVFSPDGTMLAFGVNLDATWQIVLMELGGDGSEVTIATNGAFDSTDPSWGPVATGPIPPLPPDDGGGGTPPPPPTGDAATFDGDPATTERIGMSTPTANAIAISELYFDDGGAAHVVLSRDDAFADSLAGTSLVGTGPLLYTATAAIGPTTLAEINRILPSGATVYLLGGTSAIGPAVEAAITAEGYRPVRLAGPSRVETAIAVADEARRLYPTTDVIVARAYGAPGNESSAWADSVTAGGIAAYTGVPIVLTPTETLHPALASWLADVQPDRSIVVGGTAAVSSAVEQAILNVARVAGAERTATSAEIAAQMWGLEPGSGGSFVVINGAQPDGWAYGLPAALISAVHGAPILMVTDGVSSSVALLLSSCGAPATDVVLIGGTAVIPSSVESQLDALDGSACG